MGTINAAIGFRIPNGATLLSEKIAAKGKRTMVKSGQDRFANERTEKNARKQIMKQTTKSAGR